MMRTAIERNGNDTVTVNETVAPLYCVRMGVLNQWLTKGMKPRFRLIV